MWRYTSQAYYGKKSNVKNSSLTNYYSNNSNDCCCYGSNIV